MLHAMRWFVIIVLFSGCYRGCELRGCGGEPAKRCDDSSDCDRGTSCRQHYCVSDTAVKLDDDCKHHDACEERGECSSVYRRSFLGLDQSTECAATTDAECRQSRLCKDFGACARVGESDVGCGAATSLQCAQSTRCATREECRLEGISCVRDLGCRAVRSAAQPAWAELPRLAWDYGSLRAPSHPGDQAAATIACEFTGTDKGSGTIRLPDRSCIDGPSLGHHNLSAGVPLATGDVLTVVVQRDPRIGYPGDFYIKLAYHGDSPMTVADEHGSVECLVVPHDVALARAKRELAAVDRDTAAVAHEQPSLARVPAGIEVSDSARVHAERAAMWLGWAAPELVTRVQAIDAARAAYEKRLGQMIDAAPQTTRPVTAGPFRVTLNGQVCGAALRARLGSGADDCAVELAITNPSKEAHYASQYLSWLRPATDAAAATVVPVSRIATWPSALAPGEQAVVLVPDYQAGALLMGNLGYRASFAIKP